jgi:hypothetical protein
LLFVLIDIIILGSAGFSFIRTRVILSCFFIFVPAFLAKPLAFICIFPLWFSAIYAYDIFVDILYVNIKVIERVRSKYKVVERNININTPSLTVRILVTILSSFLVLSKTSGSFLYPFIHLLKVLISVTIILVLF